MWIWRISLRAVAWIGARVADQTDRELYDPESVRRQLEELQLRWDLGGVDESEYVAAEDELLARLAAIRDHEAAERMSTRDHAG
ncbi:MAG: gas vesicle protein GvpG [Candidatus Thermoplasmatota archaeon]